MFQAHINYLRLQLLFLSAVASASFQGPVAGFVDLKAVGSSINWRKDPLIPVLFILCGSYAAYTFVRNTTLQTRLYRLMKDQHTTDFNNTGWFTRLFDTYGLMYTYNQKLSEQILDDEKEE